MTIRIVQGPSVSNRSLRAQRALYFVPSVNSSTSFEYALPDHLSGGYTEHSSCNFKVYNYSGYIYNCSDKRRGYNSRIKLQVAEY